MAEDTDRIRVKSAIKMEDKDSNSKCSKTAITGFILSLVGLPIVILTVGIVFIISMAGFVIGIISLRKINHSNGKLKGKGFSIASIILGVIGFTLFPLWILTSVIWTILLRLLGN